MFLKNKSLTDWIENNLLVVNEVNERTIELPEVGKFLLLEPKDLKILDAEAKEIILINVIFDNEFQIQLNEIEDKYCDNVDFLLFEFGDKWYYTDTLTPEVIKEFKYIGKPNVMFNETSFPYLGIHGGYELCNGSRSYEDWCKKAKFLGVTTLGICEQNTLAGTLDFQAACSKYKIKPIIGETITLLTESKAKVSFKLYVENEEGWRNLLWINKLINVDNGGEFIKEAELFNKNVNTKGLICIITPEIDLNKYFDIFFASFSTILFQIDFTEWSNQSRDENWLNAIKFYLDTHPWRSDESPMPVLICDSYYLDKQDHIIKASLNNIGKVGFKSQSSDQYFKSIDDVILQASVLFAETDDRCMELINTSVANTSKIFNAIEFKVPTGLFRLPEYEMTVEERSLYPTIEDMLWAMIEQGLEAKVFGKVENEDLYLDRISTEFEVIKNGNVLSYFLILADIIKWCKSQDILVGIGRGSSAGSLIAYCMDITKIDPIKYDLLFERFLNAGRIGKSLPDIDTDFPGERRDEVKAYIENKYGKDYVASIGSYTTMKIKSSLKDLAREKGVDYNKTNYIVAHLEAENTFTDLFKIASGKADVKTFVQKNYGIVEKLQLCLNQPKSASIHASGVLIVPKDHGSIYYQMPVKLIDGLLVSEWEGEYIDSAGFLKCDILGIKQLDKLAAIFKLIKETTGKVVTFDDMDLNNPDVMALFQDGFTEDVFQFGTLGLKAYCKELKPDNIDDLIAAVALYRPGAMETGAHKKYIRIKNGEEKLDYDPGTETITKNTYGILVYQEQIMQVCSYMAGFNLIESDDIRKALGKKDQELLDSYKDKFVQGCLKNGYQKSKIIELWDKMESFAKYSFNKSHAAAYAITGYYCQWLKYHYPMAFWTISMQYAEDKDIINRISEITKVSDIEVATVDINKSTKKFYSEGKTIYWSINSVKWVGDKAVDEILHERVYKGEFYSVEDFCDRMQNIQSRSINKRCIVNLILAGAFDKIEKVKPKDRYSLLMKYVSFSNKELNEDLLESKNWREYQWILKQKELTGYGILDFEQIVSSSKLFASQQKKFKDLSTISYGAEDLYGTDIVVCGFVLDVMSLKSKKGKWVNIGLVGNTEFMRVYVWNSEFEKWKDDIAQLEGKIIIMNVKLSLDNYRNVNVLSAHAKSQLEII